MSSVVVAGSCPDIYYTIFQLDTLEIKSICLNKNDVLDIDNALTSNDENNFYEDIFKLPRNNSINWLLLLGNNDVKGKYLQKFDFGEFSLFQKKLDLKLDQPINDIVKISGLPHPQKDFGTWSEDNNITFEFPNKLPKKFYFCLEGLALGPNTSDDFIFNIGHFSKAFRIDENMQELCMEIDNYENENKFSIIIPHPVTPKSLNINNDTRTLGIMIKNIKLYP